MVFRPFYGICFLFFYWTAHSISYLKILPDSINILLEFLLKKVVSKKLSYTFTTVCLPKCEVFSKIKTGGKQKKYEIFFLSKHELHTMFDHNQLFFSWIFFATQLHVKLRKNFCEWRDFYRPYCTICPNFSIPDPGLCKIYIIKIKTNQGSRFQPLLPARFSGQVPMGASL